MTEMPRISGGRADAAAIATVARLFDEVGDHKELDLLRWQYTTPAGSAYLAFAHTGDDVHATAVAVYVALPFAVSHGGASRIAVQSIDTLTLPSHRGLGLVTILASEVYAAAESDGAVAVFGFPNGAFNPIATRRLSWHSLDPLPLLVRPVGLRYVRRRSGLRHRACSPWAQPRHERNGIMTRRVGQVPADLSVLGAAADAGRIGVTHDLDYIRWRSNRVGANYLILESRASDGSLVAVGMAALEPKHGCNLGYVLEVMARPDDGKAKRTMLRLLVASLRDSGADLVLGWGLPGDWRRSYRRAGFVKFPPRLRPFELHFGVRVLSGAPSDWPLRDRDAWRISYLDSDTV